MGVGGCEYPPTLTHIIHILYPHTSIAPTYFTLPFHTHTSIAPPYFTHTLHQPQPHTLPSHFNHLHCTHIPYPPTLTHCTHILYPYNSSTYFTFPLHPHSPTAPTFFTPPTSPTYNSPTYFTLPLHPYSPTYFTFPLHPHSPTAPT